MPQCTYNNCIRNEQKTFLYYNSQNVHKIKHIEQKEGQNDMEPKKNADPSVEPGELGLTAYPLVSIVNSTPFIANGDVKYPTFLCTNDHYTVTPNTTWIAKSRGLCLVTKITATVKTPSGNIEATPYTSDGTTFSQFAIIQTGENQFEVTRRVS